MTGKQIWRPACPRAVLNRAQLLNWQRAGSKKDAAKILEMADIQSKISRVRILGSAAQMGHAGAVKSLFELLQSSSDRQTIRSAALYLQKSGAQLTASSLSSLAAEGHEISYKPFKWHVEAMPAADLSALIASLIKTAPAQPIEPFWQLIGRKLDASPSPIQSRQRDALFKTLGRLAGSTRPHARGLGRAKFYLTSLINASVEGSCSHRVAAQFREDIFGENFTQFNAPLIKTVDPPRSHPEQKPCVHTARSDGRWPMAIIHPALSWLKGGCLERFSAARSRQSDACSYPQR